MEGDSRQRPACLQVAPSRMATPISCGHEAKASAAWVGENKLVTRNAEGDVAAQQVENCNIELAQSLGTVHGLGAYAREVHRASAWDGRAPKGPAPCGPLHCVQVPKEDVDVHVGWHAHLGSLLDQRPRLPPWPYQGLIGLGGTHVDQSELGVPHV